MAPAQCLTRCVTQAPVLPTFLSSDDSYGAASGRADGASPGNPGVMRGVSRAILRHKQSMRFPARGG